MGKASILLVISFSIFFLLSGLNLSDISVRAMDNALDYYEAGVARNIAITGANIAANKLFINPPGIAGNPWWVGYTVPISFGGGSFTVTVDSVMGPGAEKRLLMRSSATYGDSTCTVAALMRASNFAKFALYAGAGVSNSVYWETGDSCFGPSHTEGTMHVTGRPWFGGKATVKNGVDSTSWAGHPEFAAGLETGVSIPMNTSYQKLATAAADNGRLFTQNGKDLHLEFKRDSVTWHIQGNPDTTTLLTSFAPNGAIALTGNADIFVKGIVKGRVTIGALHVGHGRVFIEGDLVYNTDPTVDPTSTDMLGVVANREIQIQDNGAASFKVMASLFSLNDGIKVDNYNHRNPGIMYTLGGWIVNTINATSNGYPLGHPSSHGYKVGLHFDERFRTSAPPYFPTTNGYEILAWYE